MKSRSTALTLWLIALFVCAQLFSLAGAMDSFVSESMDDIDPEEIVTVDPFVGSNLKTIDVIPAFHFVVVVISSLLQARPTDDSARWIAASADGETCKVNKLWLVHRSLLL